MRFIKQIAAIAGLAIAAPAAAQDSAPEIATPAMWRVADADSEFILLGTFHILPPGLVWRSEAFETAWKEADAVYFEVDTDEPNAQSKSLNVIMMEGFIPNGGTLTGMLEPADAQKLRVVVASLGLPIAGIDVMRPWNAFLTLSVQFIVQQGFDPSAGVDSVLLKEARTLGKETRFFETLEEQLGLFTGLDPQTEKDLLLLTIREWDRQAASFDILYDAWRTGDVGRIDYEMNEAMRDTAPDVYAKLIVDRNRAWATTLDKAMKEGAGKALIAVGAGHLAGGDYSVPAMLAEMGYEVTRYGAAAPRAANDNAPEDDVAMPESAAN